MPRAPLAAVLLAALAAAQSTPTYPNLVYANLGGEPLELDLYLPPNAPAPFPTVVWIHGGSWSGGARFPLPDEAAQLLGHGIAVASVDYRLTRDDGLYPGFLVTFPAQIHDVKGAVRWLRANATQYGLDANRIGAFGRSAGGHLAALLATSGGVSSLEGSVGGNLGFSSVVQCAADWFGPTELLQLDPDFTDPPGQQAYYDPPGSAASHLIGFDQPGQGLGVLREHASDPNAPYPYYLALARAANPITWIDAGDPPLFVAHGADDTTVPMRQSERFIEALTVANAPVTWDRALGYGHGLDGAHALAVDLFFRQRFFGACTVESACAGSASTGVCPCANFGGVGHGCANSVAWSDGALLTAGGAEASSLTLLALGLPSTTGCIVMQGSSTVAPSLWGDGQRCIGGVLVRIAYVQAAAGSVRFPDPAAGDPSIQDRSAQRGAPIPPGATRHYQVYYRNSAAAFCPAPLGGTFNATNAVSVVWP
ncbi:MAG: alpha/beta hydrolase [Planctomycetes bacterium]|nr:alpha/beta hydrolase [Planctomycetota bacterium]